ncbi:MAG: hypothetical protein D6E12_14015 [Desulfovibrio sp.]|nr:MAG: hypothetical protein D6E12_14015 [Desulfovibrio sp.]
MPAALAGVHRETFVVRTYEMDARWRATLVTLCSYFQEVAYEHAAILGVSQDSFVEQGIAWMLGALSVRVARYPEVREHVVMETWPDGSNKLYAFRNFRAVSQEGEVLARGASAWVVLDIAKRALTRMPQAVRDIHPPQAEGVGIDPFPPRLNSLDSWQREVLFPVRHADLDPNSHVNNTQYIQWAIEAAPDELASQQPAGIDISFRAECRHPDTVASRSSSGDVGEHLSVVHSLVRSDGKETARARTLWTV